MEATALKELAINSLENMKGQDIVCLDVSKFTTVCDYMIVVTGTSNRNLKALANEVSVKVKEAGAPVLGIEGQNQAEWVLLDLGDVIVHVMLAATRELYDLESLWSMTVEREADE